MCLLEWFQYIFLFNLEAYLQSKGEVLEISDVSSLLGMTENGNSEDKKISEEDVVEGSSDEGSSDAIRE